MPTYRITKPYTARSRPIIFNGEMVRAILDGRKTQTRRVIKSPTEYVYVGKLVPIQELSAGMFEVWDDWLKCPYGKKGDFLWVRETFREVQEQPGIMYRADGWEDSIAEYKLKWKPSIHMPRMASRISLRIVDIRVERIRDISIDDCVAEGVPQYTFARGVLSDDPPDQRWKFIELWDSINAKKGYGWDENPWVWVVEFERIEDE